MIEISRILEVPDYIDGLKAVVFDLDDTLYGEKEYIRSGYHAIAGVLTQVTEVEVKLWRLFNEGASAIDELLKQEGIMSAELKQECLTAYRFQKPDIRLYNGVSEMLTGLRIRGYRIGIITDGRPEGQKAKIEALGLEALADSIIVTDELGGIEFRKPNPKAFQLMADKLDVRFSEMCYVGDNMQKDFGTPECLGMRPIWFHNRDGLYSGKGILR